MPTILSRPEWADRVTATVTKALADDRVEVREKAAVVLGGLVHCRFINEESRTKMLVSNSMHMNGEKKVESRQKVPSSLLSPPLSLLD